MPLVQSLNSKVDLVVNGTSYSSLAAYGQIMIGNHGFEFYHHHEPHKFIQIPWSEIFYVKAQAYFKGRWVPRFIIVTKDQQEFPFASRQPMKVLKLISRYIGVDKMYHSLSLMQIIRRGLKAYWRKWTKKSVD